MNVRIRSLYLCVTDMDRAIDFYEKFLERPVLKRDEVYSVFEADGFRLGLFAFQKAGEEHTFGSNCLPSIEVEDLETLRQKLSGLPVCFPLTRIGSNWVAEFVDSEGKPYRADRSGERDRCGQYAAGRRDTGGGKSGFLAGRSGIL